MPRNQLHAQPQLRLRIEHGIAIGPGKADLLERIHELGSISAASRAMKMGYRTAWLLVDTMNAQFLEPLVLSTKGGAGGGGGATLTPLGVEVLQRYRAMEVRALHAITQDMAYLESLIKPALAHTPGPEHSGEPGLDMLDSTHR